MRNGILSAIVSLSVVLSLGSVQPAAAQFYTQHNLVSDGFVPADHPDPNMVNAWGLVSGPTTPWWIADNGSGRTTLYNVGTGAIQAIFTVPGAAGQQGTPTGVVFNGGTGFVVTNSGGTRSEEHTSELQSRLHLVCRLLLEKKKKDKDHYSRYKYGE